MARTYLFVFVLLVVTLCTAVIHEEPDCPPEMPFVNCTLSPCDTEHVTCDAQPDAECRADYCGGCVAKFYNEYGQELHCETVVGVICENKNTTLGCQNSDHVLTIKYANYGRESDQICLHPYGLERLHNNTNCITKNSTDIIRNLCQGKNSCHPEVNNVVFGDPCYGIYKYLEVDFICDTEVVSAAPAGGRSVLFGLIAAVASALASIIRC